MLCEGEGVGIPEMRGKMKTFDTKKRELNIKFIGQCSWLRIRRKLGLSSYEFPVL